MRVTYGFLCGDLSCFITILLSCVFLQSCRNGWVVGAPLEKDRSTNSIIRQLGAHNGIIEKRMATVPSLRLIAHKIQAGGQMAGKVSIFWSSYPGSNAGYRAAKLYGQAVHPCKWVLYDGSLPHEDYAYFTSVNPDDPPTPQQSEQKIQVISAAYAQQSAGKVYVLVPDNQAFRPNSVWTNYEFPNLTRNPAVTSIVLLRDSAYTEEIIWRSSQGPQGAWPPPGADPDIFG